MNQEEVERENQKRMNELQNKILDSEWQTLLMGHGLTQETYNALPEAQRIGINREFFPLQEKILKNCSGLTMSESTEISRRLATGKGKLVINASGSYRLPDEDRNQINKF